MVRRARSVVIALIASLALVPLSAGAAAAYEPGFGPVFNQPRPKGNNHTYRIANHIAAAIRHVRSGEEIKIATYSHDLRGVTDALVNAHRRGVSVQMVINDNWTSFQTRRLIKRLGKDRSKRSFVHVCQGACRGAGERTNEHAKFYLFSKSGTAGNIVMTGSANTTGFAATVHWNDLFTAKRVPKLYAVYRGVFEQMKNDDGDPNGYKTYNADGYSGYFFPKYGFSRADDPVMHRLNAVRCDAGSGGIGGRTAIRINMYAWTGDRGLWIANRLAELKRRGCNVRAIVSKQGHLVLKKLKSAGITVRSASLDLDGNPTNGWGGSGVEVFTHQKWMVLNGRYKGAVGRHVWTGSDNWSDLSNNNDEVVIHIHNPRVYSAYMRNFDLMWTRWTRAL